MVDLSVLIPSRNELFLSHTVRDLLANIRADTEILVALDGAPALEPLPEDDRVHIVAFPISIGQRAATNALARMAQGRYLMKLDAHCSVAEGFDSIMLHDAQPNETHVPVMKNLHVYDWLCSNGHRRYQSPSGVCTECGEPTHMDIVWIAKPSPNSKAYCFDATPHFQYFREFNKRPEGIGALTESMSLQGSCFMLSQERYFALNACDESFGSWGSQGIEVACKTWLSGGRVIVNHNTWHSHCFRTAGGDWGFPYPLSHSQTEHARQRARELFFEGKWQGAVRPLSWLVERFWPVPGWSEEDLRRLKALSITPA